MLSEFICNPRGGLETEWIEIYNPADFAVNLREYQVGDALGWRRISDSDIIVQPEQFVILAEDVERFFEYYNDFRGIAVSPVGWQTLNNSGGEVVRIGDQEGNTIDSFYYESGFANNRSWERYIDSDSISYWGGSFAAEGSTPGRPNAFRYPRVRGIDIHVCPDPFSPDGDGFEDETMIIYDIPNADNFEMAIYDIAGWKVKTLIESGACIPGEIRWDGRDDAGRKLPVGIYIIHARIDGDTSMESKKTVVLAR
jgi:hypothetical protein